MTRPHLVADSSEHDPGQDPGTDHISLGQLTVGKPEYHPQPPGGLFPPPRERPMASRTWPMIHTKLVTFSFLPWT